MAKKKAPKEKKKFEFSKLIIVFETVLVAYVSYKVLGFAEMCIISGYTGTLAFLTTMISAVWAAYGFSVSFYYNKAKAENVPKIQGSYELQKIAQEIKTIKVESPANIEADCDDLLI
jgi:hypothetical protein